MGIITGEPIPMRSGVTVIARVVGNQNLPVTQASLDKVEWVITDVTLGKIINTGTLTISSVIFDSLQATKIWTKDKTGFNFQWTAPAANFINGGDRYQIDIKFTPTSGEVFIQSFQFTALKDYF